MNQVIKPSYSTQFPVGSKVEIVEKGQTCSTYKDMARYMDLGDEWSNGRNPFRNGDIGVVVAKAMHEGSCYGEVLAVRVGGEVALIVAEKGVKEVEESIVIGKPKLPAYELAPLTPDAYDALEKHVLAAPSWATHIGSDDYGVHFFDHHPHKYNRTSGSFLKGMLPETHRAKCSFGREGATSELKVMVLPKVAVEEPIVTISLGALKEGQLVKLISDNEEHRHWGFKIGEVYTVGKNTYGHVGPLNPNNHVPSTDWGQWKWEVMPTPEPTVEELKAELATVKAKLWEAEWKLNKMVEVATNGIL